jgi:hypothetical protein
MRTLKNVLMMAVLAVVLSTCTKSIAPVTPTHPFGDGNGKITFWTSNKSAELPLKVSVLKTDSSLIEEGEVKTMMVAAPQCGDSLCFSFEAYAGNYIVVVISSDPDSLRWEWKSRFTVTADTCHTFQFN